MIVLSEYFSVAASDYLFLLEKNYPQKSILKMVGDRYQLSGTERSMLYRGIIRTDDCKRRKKKKCASLTQTDSLSIDGYNVIRTIGSYLLGLPVFISMDGFLRDASEMHQSTLKKKILDETIELMLNFFQESKPGEITIFLDEPVSKSGELAARLNGIFMKESLKANALTVHSPDHHLKNVTKEIISTADSAIIDHCPTKVFDLASAILLSNFQPEFINFEEMILTNK